MARPKFTLMQVQKAVSYSVGVFIAMYETVVENVDRPQLLILAAGLLGLPTFVKRDEKKPPSDETPPGGTG